MGFLIAAGYVSIRDKNYSMLIFSVPFWLVGIYLVKNKFLNKRVERNGASFITFAFVVSSLLVVIAFSFDNSIELAFPEFYIGLIVSIAMVVAYFVINKKFN